MAVNDIFRVNIEATLHGQRVIMTRTYRESVAGGVGVNASSILAGLVANNIVPALKAITSAEVAFTRNVVQKFWPLPPLVPFIGTTAAGPGSVAGDSLPTSVALVVTLRTAFAGRKYRGRVYVFGVPVTWELNSQLDPARLAITGTFASTLDDTQIDAGSAMEFVPIVWHRVSKTWDTVTAGEVRVILRNQRRRQVGKGE